MMSCSGEGARWAVDIEANGLKDEATVVWCMAAKNLDTSESPLLFVGEDIPHGLGMLANASMLVMHNGIDYDLPVLQKVLGWEPSSHTKIRDSLTWAKLTHLALDAEDLASRRSEVRELNGSHSLKSWGIRLGCHKGEYTGGWAAYNAEMGDYCLQDCEVLYQLVKHLETQWYTEEALELEHKARWRSVRMTQRGYAFDLPAALKLNEEITATLAALEEKAAGMVAPVVTYEQQKKPDYWEVKVISTGEVVRKPTRGECDQWRKDNKIKPKDCEFLEGPPRIKEIVTPFNPGSRTQVRKYLNDKYGWVSPELTEKGEELIGQVDAVELGKQYGKLSEDILRSLDNEDGKVFADIFMARKIKGFLENDKGGGWLSRVKNGRIHHHMDTLGAVTCRCTHHDFNISQTPSVVLDKETKKPVFGLKGRYGADCRSLFVGTDGYSVVGTDLNAIEARVLGHWLYPYDNGRYCDLILNGDIHNANVEAIKKIAGYTIARNAAKGPFYAYLYSSGKIKLGKVVATPVGGSMDAYEEFLSRRDYYRKFPLKIETKVWSDTLKTRRTATPEEAAYWHVGAKVTTAFEQGIVGLPQLSNALKEAVKARGYIKVFDRRLPVRHAHAVLNTLFQGTAAILAKYWMTSTFDTCEQNNVEAHLLVYAHDEVGSDVRQGQEQAYKEIVLDRIVETGKHYGMRLPLDGDCRIGRNWCETH